MMSYFIHNEQCPRCRKQGNDLSKDNLAVYSDEHKYCFRCGYYVPADKIHIIKSYIEKPTKYNLQTPGICDFTLETITYLKRYGLTDDEIYGNLSGHKDGYVFKTSNFYLIRRLHEKPKVMIYGNVVGNEPVWLSDNDTETITICEDVLSAIKISRVISSCALLKTAIHDKLLVRLSKQFNNCILWLDPDMHTHMIKIILPKIKPYFKEVKVIMSEKDPKEYSTENIREQLIEMSLR